MNRTANESFSRAKLMAALAALLLALATAIAAPTAYAAESTANGNWGACAWDLSTDGVLTVAPRNGSSGMLGSSESDADVPWLAYADSIKQVVFRSGVQLAPASEFLFSNCVNLTSVDASGVDSSALEDAWCMFDECNSLMSLDLSGWDVSNVRDFGIMFRDCYELKTLNLDGWNPSSATNLSSMFSGCSSLTSLDLAGWDTSNVTDMSDLFSACNEITSIDTSGWDTSNVTNMAGMFNACKKLDSFYLFDTDKVEDMSYMFRGCESLKSFSGDFMCTDNVENMSFMFEGCSALESIYDLDCWDVSNVRQMSNMFDGCSSLTSLLLIGWDTSLVWHMGGMFENCSSLETIYVGPEWTTASIDTAYNQDMFVGCTSLVGGNGTAYSSDKVSCKYAHVDTQAKPGYFTVPESMKVDISSASLSLGKSSYAYSGKECKPAVTVTVGGNAVPSDSLTVTYKDNKNPGTATVTVVGSGAYTGSASVKFSITKGANPLVVKAKTIKAKAKKKTSFKAKKAFAVSKAQGTVAYKKASGDKKIAVAKNGKITVKKGLKKGKTYKVKVKVTAAGNQYYKAGSKTVTVKVKIK